jgi:hypothetical protein
MATEQPYLIIEGGLHWISSASDAFGMTTHTYLMDHVPGEVKITSSIPLDTGTQTRIVKLQEMNIRRPLITKESLGHSFVEGAFSALGVVVDTVPENGIDVREYITDNMKPAEIDHTFGKGTIWEQLAASQAGYDETDDDSPSEG